MDLKDRIKNLSDKTTSKEVKELCQSYLNESEGSGIDKDTKLTESLFNDLKKAAESDDLVAELLTENDSYAVNKRKIEAKISGRAAQQLMENWEGPKKGSPVGNLKDNTLEAENQKKAAAAKALNEGLVLAAKTDPSAGKVLKDLRVESYGIAEAIQTIKTSKVMSTPQLKYAIARYEEHIANNVSESRFVKDFLSNIAGYNWDPTINEAYSAVKTLVDAKSVELEVQNAIQIIAEQDKKRFFDTTIETLNKWLMNESRSIPSLVQDMKQWMFNPVVNDLVKHVQLLENSYGNKFNVPVDSSNCTISTIYSPVTMVAEGTIFRTGDSYFLSGKENGISRLSEEQVNGLPVAYTTLCENFFNNAVRCGDDGIRVHIGSAKVTINEHGTFIGESAVEPADLGQKLLFHTQKTMFNSDGGLINVACALQEGFDQVAEIDYGKSVFSNLYEGVGVYLFRKDEKIYINKVNPTMNENTFNEANAVQTVNTVKEFLNYDLSESLIDMLDGDMKKKSLMESAMAEVLGSIELVEAEINKIDEAIEKNADIADVAEVQAAKEMLEAELNKLQSEWHAKSTELEEFVTVMENEDEDEAEACEKCECNPCECASEGLDEKKDDDDEDEDKDDDDKGDDDGDDDGDDGDDDGDDDDDTPPADDIPADDADADDAPVDDIPADDVDDAPMDLDDVEGDVADAVAAVADAIGDAPELADGAPELGDKEVDDSPVDDVEVDVVPVDDIPADDAPVDDIPADVDDAPVDDVPAEDDAPVDDAPVDDEPPADVEDDDEASMVDAADDEENLDDEEADQEKKNDVEEDGDDAPADDFSDGDAPVDDAPSADDALAAPATVVTPNDEMTDSGLAGAEGAQTQTQEIAGNDNLDAGAAADDTMGVVAVDNDLVSDGHAGAGEGQSQTATIPGAADAMAVAPTGEEAEITIPANIETASVEQQADTSSTEIGDTAADDAGDVDDFPVDDAPVDDIPADDIPADDNAPVDDVDDAPVDDIPADVEDDVASDADDTEDAPADIDADDETTTDDESTVDDEVDADVEDMEDDNFDDDEDDDKDEDSNEALNTYLASKGLDEEEIATIGGYIGEGSLAAKLHTSSPKIMAKVMPFVREISALIEKSGAKKVASTSNVSREEFLATVNEAFSGNMQKQADRLIAAYDNLDVMKPTRMYEMAMHENVSGDITGKEVIEITHRAIQKLALYNETDKFNAVLESMNSILDSKKKAKPVINEALDVNIPVCMKGSDKKGVITAINSAEQMYTVLWDGGESGDYGQDQLEELSADIADNDNENQEAAEAANKKAEEENGGVPTHSNATNEGFEHRAAINDVTDAEGLKQKLDDMIFATFVKGTPSESQSNKISELYGDIAFDLKTLQVENVGESIEELAAELQEDVDVVADAITKVIQANAKLVDGRVSESQKKTEVVTESESEEEEDITVWTKAKVKIDFGPFKEDEKVDVDASQFVSAGDDDSIKLKNPKDEIKSIPKKYLVIEDGGENTHTELSDKLENALKSLKDAETLLQSEDKINKQEITDAVGKVEAFKDALKTGE